MPVGQHPSEDSVTPSPFARRNKNYSPGLLCLLTESPHNHSPPPWVPALRPHPPLGSGYLCFSLLLYRDRLSRGHPKAGRCGQSPKGTQPCYWTWGQEEQQCHLKACHKHKLLEPLPPVLLSPNLHFDMISRGLRCTQPTTSHPWAED